MSVNYYQILGVDKNATLQQITKAYYKLALKWHPDRPGGSEEKFKEIVEAYEVLSNPQEQKNYNNCLERGIEWHGSNNSSGGLNSNSYNKAYSEFHDKGLRINEIFLSIYNFHPGACSILNNSQHSGWVDRLWEIEFSEVENYKNQLLNFVKAELEKRNNNQHTQNPNGQKGQKEKCYVCLKWVNSSEVQWYDRGKGEKTPLCGSSECKDKIAEGFGGSEQKPDQLPNNSGWTGDEKPTPNYTHIEEIKNKIEFYKERLMKTSDEREKQKYQEMMSNLEKELETLRNQSNNQKRDTPKKSEPSPEQISTAKDKLDEALNSNDKDEIANTLNETNETAKTSADPDLKKKKEQAEDRLGEIDPEKLRQIIKEEVAKELAKLGIKKDDLSSENKQKLDELNNNEVEATQAKGTRDEVLKDAGIKALEKLITEVEQAIKAGDEKKIKSKYKELQEFTQNNSEYAQNAYEKQKTKVQELLEKAKNWSGQNTNKSNNNFPNGWVVGGGILLLLGLVAVLIIRKKGKKKH